jgi:HlyD family secretion protein
MTEQQSGESTKIATPVAAPPQAVAVIPPAKPVIEHHPPGPARVWTRRLLILALLGGGAGYLYWQAHRVAPLPSWIAMGNGRLEADPIDIATKFAGRIAELRADEGDKVTAGQIVAVMDTRDLAQNLKRDEALVEQAQRAIDEARASATQAQSATKLAEQEMSRTQKLAKSGYATRELLDQRQQALAAAQAAQDAAEHRISQANQVLSAANHAAELVQVNIADNTLVAPRDGRIQYRLAAVGEVLGVGGKVFTMLDTSYVYMDIYLSTLQADKVKIGAQARILLDAYPDRPIPAKVSFLADQAQFTPKMVETKSDRDRMMFRVRVKIDPARARDHANEVRSGLPGLAYVKLDEKKDWPEALKGRDPVKAE